MAEHREANENKVREAATNESRQLAERKFLYSLFMQAPAVISIYRGPKHILELANPLYMKVVGRSDPYDLIGKPVREALPELEGQGFYELLDHTYATGDPFMGAEMPARVDRLGNGELDEGFFTLTLQPIRDAQGSIEGVMSHAVEVTDHVRMRQALQASEERYRTLFNSIDEGFCVIEVLFDESNSPIDYIFVEINPTFEEQTGLEGALGKTAIELVPNLEQRWFDIYGKVALTGEPMRFTEGSDVMNRWFDVYAFRLGGDESRKVAILFNDITERKKLEQRKDDFLALASHELRTPITSLKLYAQLLKKRLDTRGDADTAKQLDRMDKQIDKLIELVRGLLDVSRIEAGKVDYRMERIDLDALIRETVEDLQRVSDKHRIVLDGVQGGMVIADSERIEQVLTNLITNAIKYSPDKDKVIVSAERLGEEIKVSVQDFGIGISEVDRSKIFDRFFQVSGAGRDVSPGLGLGLYISSEIVKRHGGRIEIESEVGRGSKFYFTLPIRAGSDDNFLLWP